MHTFSNTQEDTISIKTGQKVRRKKNAEMKSKKRINTYMEIAIHQTLEFMYINLFSLCNNHVK